MSSVGIRTSRVITVWDNYGYPIPKLIDIEFRGSVSRASSPNKSEVI